MSALTRGVIGVCALSGVCGGGYGLHKLLSNDSIESKLKANEYVLLTNSIEHEKHWDEILASYKATIQADNNSKFKFDNFVISNTQPNAEDKTKLKEHCKKTLKKRTFEDNEEAEYNKAKRWCVIPSTVSEKLATDKFEVLDTTTGDGATNKHDNEWAKKIKAYIDSKNTNKIASWTNGAPTQDNKEDKEKLINKCKELVNTKTHQPNYEKAFEDAKNWCIMPKESGS
ncbi:hypothetical protein A6V39_00145 [Candidatus Mycoplasma haematobovis]|uniref:Uncharacterized protein n=1 Tax=Candidatus Mycoplasma haematobovis TaxID=432608 RepID=A0A1A9QFG9_9MOLU|nr:hypothetical protein [Candidatus Mycoplasma haematobovis]OAL10459.1 hypothetical protein A6V39_00145 [Candidatus Mycoplasma haematobovis]